MVGIELVGNPVSGEAFTSTAGQDQLTSVVAFGEEMLYCIIYGSLLMGSWSARLQSRLIALQ